VPNDSDVAKGRVEPVPGSRADRPFFVVLAVPFTGAAAHRQHVRCDPSLEGACSYRQTVLHGRSCGEQPAIAVMHAK